MIPEEIHKAGLEALEEWVVCFVPYNLPLSANERLHLEETLRKHKTSAYKLVYPVGVSEKPVVWLAIKPREVEGKIRFTLLKVKL